MCDELLDSWTLAIRRLHALLDSEECQMKLMITAMLAMCDISKLESRHADVRRLLFARSTNRPHISLCDLGSAWILKRFRLRQRTPTVRAGTRRKTTRARKANVGWTC